MSEQEVRMREIGEVRPFLASSSRMVLLNYLSMRCDLADEQFVSAEKVANELNEIQNRFGISVYEFPKNNPLSSRGFHSDIKSLEGYGLVRFGLNDDQNIELTGLGRLFSQLSVPAGLVRSAFKEFINSDLRSKE